MPLFVLNTVVFPKLEFPMHIFEPRYRLMLRRCLEGQKRFGLVGCKRTPDGRWLPASVGCVLQITDHRVCSPSLIRCNAHSRAQALPDGRSYVDCIGTRRFRVLERWDQDGYLCGKVQYFDDEPLANEDAKRQFTAAAASTRTKLSEALVSLAGNVSPAVQQLLARAGDIPADDVDFAFWLSSHFPLDQEVKQELLEMTDPIGRMNRLNAYLTAAIGENCILM